MKKSHVLLAAAATFAVVGLFILNSASGQNAGRPAPNTKVAVCDVVEVFNNYNRAKDLTQQLNDRREKIKSADSERAKKIERLQLEIEGLKKGGPKYQELMKEIERLSIERQIELQYEDTLALREHHRLTREMYREILGTVEALAKQRGYDIVVTRETEQVETKNTSELVRWIQSRKVIYHNDEVDLTQDVLGQLNRSYRSR
ncbi:MAG: OmpH family outer membrane protein [Phycisphaerae bacterium]